MKILSFLSLLLLVRCSWVPVGSEPRQQAVVLSEIQVQWDFQSLAFADWMKLLTQRTLGDLPDSSLQCDESSMEAKIDLSSFNLSCVEWLQSMTPLVHQLFCKPESPQTLFLRTGRRDCGAELRASLDSIALPASQQLFRTSDDKTMTRLLPSPRFEKLLPLSMNSNGPWNLEQLPYGDWIPMTGSDQALWLVLIPQATKVSPGLEAQLRALEGLLNQSRAPKLWNVSIQSWGLQASTNSSLGPNPGLLWPQLQVSADSTPYEKKLCGELSDWLEAEALLGGVRILEPKRRFVWSCRVHLANARKDPLGLRVTSLPIPLRLVGSGRVPFRSLASLADPLIFESLKFAR
jgi:hypothetical protein